MQYVVHLIYTATAIATGYKLNINRARVLINGAVRIYLHIISSVSMLEKWRWAGFGDNLEETDWLQEEVSLILQIC